MDSIVVNDSSFLDIPNNKHIKIIISDSLSNLIEYDVKSNTLYISNNYFVSDKQKVLTSLINYLKKFRGDTLEILSSSLINKEVLRAIVDNPYIRFLKLGRINDSYILTREAFDILNSSSSLLSIDTLKVDGDYTKEERCFLDYFNRKNVFDLYSLNDIIQGVPLNFYQPLYDEQIDYLVKYLPKESIINFKYVHSPNILKVIEALKGRKIAFNIDYFDSNLSDDVFLQRLKNVDDENIVIATKDNNYMAIKDFIQIEETLNMFVSDIKNSSLSPLEKYLAVYFIVTRYKSYNRSVDNSSRNINGVLFSDYIVCYGYADLLNKLLSKVGILSTLVFVEVWKEKEEITIDDYATLNSNELSVKESNKGYHARTMVKLVDTKYDINGVFISDPTWDSSITNSYYNHALLTGFETTLENSLFYNTGIDIFNVHSGTEFYTKLAKIPDAIETFLKVIKDIDPAFYHYLKQNYELVNASYASNFYLDMYNYIITYAQKAVGKDKLNQAFKEVNSFIYSFASKEILDKINEREIMANDKREKEFFQEERVR